MGAMIAEANPIPEITPIVLIVMPELDELATMSSVLRDVGYIHKHCTSSVLEASEVLARKSIAIVLANYEDTTWTKLLRAARIKSPEPKLILGLRSSQLLSPDCDMVLKAGVHNVLGRPYRASEVRQALGFAWQAWVRDSALATSTSDLTQQLDLSGVSNVRQLPRPVQRLGRADSERPLVSVRRGIA